MATPQSLNTVQSLYVAYYGRPADPEGLNYWAEQLEANGGNLANIINAFGNSSEYNANLGSIETSAQVNSLYQQLFGRDAEDEGLGFYTNMLNNGEKTLAEIALTIREAAQGSDRTTFEGRTAVANAFTQELDTQEEIDAYTSDRGIGIGRAYVQRVNQQTTSEDVLNEAAPVVETLIPETEPEAPPAGGGGGGVTPPPSPTFTATLDENGAVIFGGDATGPITLTESEGQWTFIRGELTDTVSGEDVTSITLGDAALAANASLLDEITVSGAGQLTLTNLTNELAPADELIPADYLDLSGLADTLNVTATVASSQNISDNENLSAIDTYQVSSGATLTLTLEQYASAALKGQGQVAFSDDIASKLTINYPDETLDSVEITLTDTNIGVRTVAEVQALLSILERVDAPTEISDLTYTLLDTSAALSSSGTGIADIVTSADNIEASDAAFISQANIIYTRNNGATYDITDYAPTILNGASDTDILAVLQAATSVTAASPVNTATAEDLHAITGFSVAYSVSDSYDDIISADAATINGAVNLSTYSPFSQLNTTQAETIIAFTNSGTTTINSISGDVTSINNFVAANERSDTLVYNFRVIDSASIIIANIGDAGFITGNPATDFDGDARVQNIEVTGTFNVTEAEDFWNAVVTKFDDNVDTTAARTSYDIRDGIAAYTNTVAALDSLQSANQRTIDGSAEDIHQAQRGTLTDNRDIFEVLKGNDRLVVTASDGSQIIDGAPGSDSISTGAGSDTVYGDSGNDTIDAGADNDTVHGDSGNDNIDGSSGNDTVYGGAGNDTIRGGDGYDYLDGDEGRDTIYAGSTGGDTGANWTSRSSELITGGQGGDNMFGSTNADIFLYEGDSRDEFVAESGTTSTTRDYIHNFSLGDEIQFQNVDDVQFFSSGSANASDVEAGELGLSIRYVKGADVLNWDGDQTQESTQLFIDIANEQGQFDDIADMHIILVGSNIDINWDGSAITYGG